MMRAIVHGKKAAATMPPSDPVICSPGFAGGRVCSHLGSRPGEMAAGRADRCENIHSSQARSGLGATFERTCGERISSQAARDLWTQIREEAWPRSSMTA